MRVPNGRRNSLRPTGIQATKTTVCSVAYVKSVLIVTGSLGGTSVSRGPAGAAGADG